MKDTKSWILDAAAILFTQNGFTKTTTKAIAELAGVSESTFFRIYKSKAALLSDLLYIMTPSCMYGTSLFSGWPCMWRRFMTSPGFPKSKG